MEKSKKAVIQDEDDVFPDEIMTARWRKGVAENYHQGLKERAKRDGMLKDAAMQEKIRTAKAQAKDAARRYEQLIGNG